ncbi:methyltransferase [Paraglaciecola aestuariivivens]
MSKTKADQNFDTLANKFERNIYGSTKGQLRHELLVHHLNASLDLQGQKLDVLDAGGGTGVMTDYLLNLGHNLTLSDISQEVLALAQQKLARHKQLTLIHTDILSLDTNKQYDLVICHAVLEWLTEPVKVIKKLLAMVKPGGHLSLSFFNYDAQLFGNMLYGNFDYVEQGMPSKNIVRLSPNNPQKPQFILDELQKLTVEVKYLAGIRCFHDYMKDLDKQQSQYEQLKRLEIQYGCQAPYLWLGKYFLVVSQKQIK